MATQKYLLLQRSEPAGRPPQPASAPTQDMYAAFNAWKEKYKARIVDIGGRLKAGGKRLSVGGVTDGPFAETKELIGGFMIVSAGSYEEALEVARECPGLIAPGSGVEVREIAGGP
jgi:hypothetical protein